MQTLSLEPMSYKQYLKKGKELELITKVRIIRAVKHSKQKIMKVAAQFHCHRNTVGNILKHFIALSNEAQHLILQNNNWKSEEFLNHLSPMLNQSRRPHHHPRQASEAVVDKVVELFRVQRLRVGTKRMKTILNRRFIDSLDPIEKSLTSITEASLRGIYKREQLKRDTVKTGNGQRRPLYDYTAIGCFEYLHYDVKHVLDQKALPASIYQTLSCNSDLPLCQWNIQDAKSRFRFLAYSRGVNAEFGLKFLLFVIQYLRWTFPTSEETIHIGMDNGVEFCSGSKDKEAEWNQALKILNAQVYTYHVGHDIRKNLIERGHLTDDQELYIARGHLMGTLTKFMTETRNYGYYFNFERPHSGIEMKNRTPYEVIVDSGLCGSKRLLNFPILVIEDEIEIIRQATDQILFEKEIRALTEKTGGKPLGQKTLLNIALKYDFFETKNAQNLLTPHHLIYFRKLLFFSPLLNFFMIAV